MMWHQRGNIKLDGVVEHRERFKADYALVVAPGFSDGALSTRCEQQRVTPIKARDLGQLLEYTVEYGAISVTKLREIFLLYDPDSVTLWVSGLSNYLKDGRRLTIDVFLKALESLKGQVPDAVRGSLDERQTRFTEGACQPAHALSRRDGRRYTSTTWRVGRCLARYRPAWRWPQRKTCPHFPLRRCGHHRSCRNDSEGGPRICQAESTSNRIAGLLPFRL